MVRILLGLLLAYLLARAIGRLIRGIAEGASTSKQPLPVGLARDPVCGTYVVPANALTAGSGRNARYFCSEGCRQAWIRR